MLDDRVLPSKIIRKKYRRRFCLSFGFTFFFFLLAREEGLSFKPKYWQICFILLFTPSSPCLKYQFAVLYFLQVIIVLIQV